MTLLIAVMSLLCCLMWRTVSKWRSDADNMPRIDPETRQGIVTDVCIKRKSGIM